MMKGIWLYIREIANTTRSKL